MTFTRFGLVRIIPSEEKYHSMSNLLTSREPTPPTNPPRSDETTHEQRANDPALPPPTVRAIPTHEPTTPRLDRIITSALGEDTVSFLISKSTVDSPHHAPMSAALEAATHVVEDPAQRANILHLLDLYNTAVDFDAKLSKPRSPQGVELTPDSEQVTVPEGESVSLIRATLGNITQYFHDHSHLLTSAREAIALTRVVSEPNEISNAPSTVHVEPPQIPPPAPPQPDAAEEGKQPDRDYLAIVTLGSKWLAAIVVPSLRALAIATARVREFVPSTKAQDRPAGGGGFLKRALESFVEFDIKGLESFASAALGMLAPRGMSERFAQTGTEEEDASTPEVNNQRRKALFKFIIDLRAIKSYFRKNPQLERCETRFYCKEAQVLLDREGKFARLDSFLMRTPEGRALFDAIYQPLSVESDTADAEGPTATLPTIPLTPTTLPLPPNHVITGIEYLDARGRRIDQPERNSLRACVAGGALITPPAEARLVRYTHTNIHTSPTETIGCAPRSLTAQEFKSFQELLPNVAFDLGEEMGSVYSLIREFSDPKVRVALAAHAEIYRMWVYSKDPLIGAVQAAAGDTFLESVYHARAGICDSMSAVASYLIGDAIGLPGLVVSGPVAEQDFFNRKVGHSIAQAILPDGVQTFDLTEGSRASSWVSGRRVPVAARNDLTAALSTPGTTRRDLVHRYRDLGDLIRGERPTRFMPGAANTAAPVRLWRDILIDGSSRSTSDNSENIPSLPNQQKIRVLFWAAAGVELDRILERCEAQENFDEFGWFLASRLKDLSCESPGDAEGLTQAWGVSERFKNLAYRDFNQEATRHLLSLTERKGLSPRVVSQFPAIAKALSIRQAITFIETSLRHKYPQEITTSLVESNLLRAVEHVRYLAKHRKELTTAAQLSRTLSALLDHHTQLGSLLDSKTAADAIAPLLHAAKNSDHRDKTPEEIKELTLAFTELLRSLWTSAGSHAPRTLCEALAEDGSDIVGLQLLLAAEPSATRTAFGLNQEKGKNRIVSEVVRALESPTPDVTAALRLVTNARELLGALDLSNDRLAVHSAAKRILRNFLKKRSEMERKDDPLINWPDERHPASYLSSISLPENGGAPALALLKALCECEGLSESDARALWSTSPELAVARRFVRESDIESGGILKVGDDYEWELSQLPNLLNAILSQSNQGRAAQTGMEILRWTEARGEFTTLPDEKHFLALINLLGGVPDQWALDGQESAIAEALIGVAQGSMKPATLYTALHAVAPYIIPPAEEERWESHLLWLRNLARTMREYVDDETATEHLAHAQRWTQKPPRPLERTIEGCALACSIADLANQLELNLTALTGAIPYSPFTHVDPLSPDTGASPHTQVWDHLFPLEVGYPYYRPPSSHLAAVALRDLFMGMPSKARIAVRSPLLTFLAAERGKIRVSGLAGIPESTRPYQPGDELRSIDWKRSARSDTLMTKIREEREERSLTIVMDLGTLGRELKQMSPDLPRHRRPEGADVRALVHGAPHFSTLVHEATIAHQNGLEVDLILTHHTVIRHHKDATRDILALDENSDHFWAGVQNDAETALKLREEEEDIFGPTLFQTSSPLSHGQVEIPRKNIIHFLMGPDSKSVVLQTVPLLQARGNRIFAGPLASFRGAQKVST